MNKPALIILLFLLSGCSPEKQSDLHLQPYKENPRYWEYKGKAVLFLGATDNHNLFQAENRNEQIQKMVLNGFAGVLLEGQLF
jgi:hypothetical protein